MRVISGTARGRRLHELQGTDTRPTTDKVKESLFNIIQFELEGRQVLDLFAGTGQLGIEALSRGSTHCTFVDMRREAITLIQENVKATQCEAMAQVIQGDALRFLAGCGAQFDVIFLDPPYQSQLMESTLEAITRFDILRENGIIICESDGDWNLPPLSPPYEQGREYRYGKIKLTICRRTESRTSL